jgi:hypothetical protein
MAGRHRRPERRAAGRRDRLGRFRARLRRQVAAQCADAGLTGTRLDDFVLAALADELSITSEPDSTIVSLYMRLE